MGTEGDVTTTDVETDVTTTDAVVSTTTAVENSTVAVDTTAEDTTAAPASTDAEGAVGTADEGSNAPLEAYADFTLPEGVVLDEVLNTEAAVLFKEDGLSQEQSQRYVDFFAKQIQAGEQKQVDAFNQQLDDWREQSANDKEFGGDAFDENVKLAQSAMAKFGSPGLKQLMEDYGVGNHPEVIRAWVKVGKLTAEDEPGNTTAPAQQEQDMVKRLYPNDVKQ